MSGYGYPPPNSTRGPNNPEAVIQMPSVGDLGGQQANVPAWYRQPFFPTSPFVSTNPRVGTQVRFYSAGTLNAVANTEVIATIQFDIPCRLIAINGAAFSTAAGNALPVGVGPRDCFLFRLEYTQGDRLHVTQRIASTVVGSGERPGELGSVGWTFDQGATVVLGITPLIANLRIDLSLHCLELRGPSNFTSR